MIKDLKMPQVVLILGLVVAILAAVVALTALGKDSQGVYTFGGAILVGLGILGGTVGQLASNTNGNWSKMMEQQAETNRMLAVMIMPQAGTPVTPAGAAEMNAAIASAPPPSEPSPPPGASVGSPLAG